MYLEHGRVYQQANGTFLVAVRLRTGWGLATLAVEHPERFEDLWKRLPEYIDKGSKLVDGAATFLEKLSQQQGGGYRNIPVAGGSRY